MHNLRGSSRLRGFAIGFRRSQSSYWRSPLSLSVQMWAQFGMLVLRGPLCGFPKLAMPCNGENRCRVCTVTELGLQLAITAF